MSRSGHIIEAAGGAARAAISTTRRVAANVGHAWAEARAQAEEDMRRCDGTAAKPEVRRRGESRVNTTADAYAELADALAAANRGELAGRELQEWIRAMEGRHGDGFLTVGAPKTGGRREMAAATSRLRREAVKATTGRSGADPISAELAGFVLELTQSEDAGGSRVAVANGLSFQAAWELRRAQRLGRQLDGGRNADADMELALRASEGGGAAQDRSGGRSTPTSDEVVGAANDRFAKRMQKRGRMGA